MDCRDLKFQAQNYCLVTSIYSIDLSERVARGVYLLVVTLSAFIRRKGLRREQNLQLDIRDHLRTRDDERAG